MELAASHPHRFVTPMCPRCCDPACCRPWHLLPPGEKHCCQLWEDAVASGHDGYLSVARHLPEAERSKISADVWKLDAHGEKYMHVVGHETFQYLYMYVYTNDPKRPSKDVGRRWDWVHRYLNSDPKSKGIESWQRENIRYYRNLWKAVCPELWEHGCWNKSAPPISLDADGHSSSE